MGLSLKMLGGFELRDSGGAELSLPTRKIRALLSYLAVNADKPQPRERLMALLWSDRGDRQARQSLNQALLSIRRLGEHEGVQLLKSDGERVTLRGDAVESDVQRLRNQIADDPAVAASLYEGTFLDGLSVPESAFEQWLLETRSELHTITCEALETAIETSDNTKTAIDCARRLVALDPLRENAHRSLMQLLHKSGDRTGALRQFQACAQVLQRELQVEPSARTMVLFEHLRRDIEPETKLDCVNIMLDTSPLLDKPSIAVLPLRVLGGDQEAGYLADGLTEDLIASLAKIPDLVVVASNSTATYKGKAVNVKDVSKALGVRYVFEGGVQKSGDKVRVTPQLIDATSGGHLWAERYDRPIGDIFAMQDDIVRHVLIELQVRLTEGDGARIASLGTRNLEAWLLRVQGIAEMGRITRDSIVRARALFEAAHKADPDWGRPLAGIAACDFYEARNGWSNSFEESIEAGILRAGKATELNPEDPFGYSILRVLNALCGNHEKALSLAKKAVSLAPNDQVSLANLGAQLIWMDEAKRAIETFAHAMRSAPIAPNWMLRNYGLALLVDGQTDHAIAVLKDLAQREPSYLMGGALYAAALARTGRIDAAKATTASILDQDPSFTVSHFLVVIFFRNPERTEWLRNLLIQAGLPE